MTLDVSVWKIRGSSDLRKGQRFSARSLRKTRIVRCWKLSYTAPAGLGMLLFIFSGLTGCSAGAIKEINEKAQAVIESRKIPDVQLTPDQVSQLRKPENSHLVWLKAGVQADGDIFVCYVAVTPDRKNIFGQSLPDLVTLHAGIFEGSKTFKDLSLPLVGDRDPLAAQHNNFQCRDRGIDPPVRQVRADELKVQRKLEEIRKRRAPKSE